MSIGNKEVDVSSPYYINIMVQLSLQYDSVKINN